jgi:type II secretory pathway pseudopilin PulG
MTGIVAVLLFPNFLEAQIRAKASRARTDMRSLAKAIEWYHIDNDAYPAWATGELSENVARCVDPLFQHVPSFRQARDGEALLTLTTPILYVGGCYPWDPFSPERGATYVYYATKPKDTDGWILVSPGPDRDYDISPPKVFDPSTTQPSPALLRLTYDPTNGTMSNGDIWIIGPRKEK